MPRKKSSKSIYAAHPIVAYGQTIIANLPEKTGRSLGEWIKLVDESGLDTEKERREWLKRIHKLGGTTAMLIAECSVGNDDNYTVEGYLKKAAEYVETMYGGKKEGLRPIHDALIELALGLGEDIKISPCKTIVPLYREHVFAEIKPATQKRVDLGLALKACKKRIPRRLIDTGGLAKGDRITHRISLESVDDIDDQAKAWLKTAYELDG